jgi:hypothetical protein
LLLQCGRSENNELSISPVNCDPDLRWGKLCFNLSSDLSGISCHGVNPDNGIFAALPVRVSAYRKILPTETLLGIGVARVGGRFGYIGDLGL